ncbi:hypothetical protein BJ165DRAFT_1398546 [Panaeolus papilionaceus]|nr:hypothetical protein BJ165DRAFT_1398546 [Panaeolus papilionaceus]
MTFWSNAGMFLQLFLRCGACTHSPWSCSQPTSNVTSRNVAANEHLTGSQCDNGSLLNLSVGKHKHVKDKNRRGPLHRRSFAGEATVILFWNVECCGSNMRISSLAALNPLLEALVRHSGAGY